MTEKDSRPPHLSTYVTSLNGIGANSVLISANSGVAMMAGLLTPQKIVTLNFRGRSILMAAQGVVRAHGIAV